MPDDVEKVNVLLKTIRPGQKLYLFVAEETVDSYKGMFKTAFEKRQVEFRIANVVSSNGEKHLFDFLQLGQSLQGFTETELKNMIFLLQDGISWNNETLEMASIPEWFGFFLMNDYESGVPVRATDIHHIGALENLLGMQS
jgi:hypothetical protein